MASPLEIGWLYLISNFSDFQLATLGSFIIHECVFFLSGLPSIFLERSGLFSKFKIQNKTNTPATYWRCILRLIFYHDFVFYWGHRILHTKWLYKHVHSVHHEFSTPFGLTSEYAHPAEILFLGLATFIGPALTGPHLFTLWLWMSLRVVETVEAHSGYDFPWSPSKFLPLYGGAEFHDFHHRVLYTKSGNYSSTFTYMDWIYGTDKAYRKQKAPQNGKGKVL